MVSRNAIVSVIFTGVVVVLASCAYQPEPEAYDPPGFFSAIFHGLVAPLALCFGIFSEIRIYAFPNSGWWYDFGFMIGLLPWPLGLVITMLDASNR